MVEDAAAREGEETIVGDATLPRDLLPIGMFLAADWIVKAVMIGLAFASVVTWSVWLAKLIELFGARRQTRRDLVVLANARSLAGAADALRSSKSDIAALARAAVLEVNLSWRRDGAGRRQGALVGLESGGAHCPVCSTRKLCNSCIARSRFRVRLRAREERNSPFPSRCDSA